MVIPEREFGGLPLRQVIVIIVFISEIGIFSPVFRGFARATSPEPAL
jgi:hypothetical protein